MGLPFISQKAACIIRVCLSRACWIPHSYCAYKYSQNHPPPSSYLCVVSLLRIQWTCCEFSNVHQTNVSSWMICLLTDGCEGAKAASEDLIITTSTVLAPLKALHSPNLEPTEKQLRTYSTPMQNCCLEVSSTSPVTPAMHARHGAVCRGPCRYQKGMLFCGM